MADFLEGMARASERRARVAREREPLPALRRRAAERPPAPRLVLDASGFDLIAEVKRRAPSAGRLAEPRGPAGTVVTAQAAAYAAAGAAAISVLTEPDAFDGSLDDLVAAAGAVDVPLLRKDFLVDPYQLFEARAAGASGALLIVRLVDDARLGELFDAAAQAGLFVLLEAFDADDLDRAAVLGPAPIAPWLVGVNARDLATLGLDAGRFARLRARFPDGAVPVAESGLLAPADVERVAASGYAVALVGSALMRSPDPGALVRSMLAAGRDARRTCTSG